MASLKSATRAEICYFEKLIWRPASVLKLWLLQLAPNGLKLGMLLQILYPMSSSHQMISATLSLAMMNGKILWYFLQMEKWLVG